MKKFYLLLLLVVVNSTSYAQWITTASMSTSRAGHVSANLTNGNVLVTGGWDYANNLISAEIYDAVTNTWTIVSSMNEARYTATATTLNDGKILVVGGYDGSSNLATSEIYNPTTDSWSSAGVLSVGRSSHTATKLQNGKVLVVGGFTGVLNTPECELYDPAANSWTSGGTLTHGRSYHTATLLDNGKVAIIGGYDPTTTFQLNSLELYDPTLNTWSAGASMADARDFHSASKLANGNILVSGGRFFTGNTPNYIGLGSAEIYNPSTDLWTTASFLTDATLCYGQQVTLNNGNVLDVAGLSSYNTPTGASVPSITYLYDALGDTWDTVPMTQDSRFQFSALLMNDGRVMVSGGKDSTVELYGVASPSAINAINNNNFIISLYPNPANDYINIKAAGQLKNFNVLLYDIKGQLIELPVTQSLTGFLQLQTTTLNPGIYFLKVKNDVGILVNKITVTH